MQKYNKAFQGGLGAAVGLILSWAISQFGGVDVPQGVEMAFGIVFAGLGPVLGPANKA